LHQQKITICSICTSAFVLAMCGLLDGKNCTTHWKRTAELQAKFPKAKVQENILFVEEKGLFTSAGVTSGIDMALHILAQLEGEYMAYKVARELVVYNRRTGIEVQQSLFMKYRNHIHVGIHNVQDWLQEQLKDYQSLSQLAEIACMSDRNLTRIFKKETGLTINEYITLLRKEKIEAMLKNPDYSRPQIAKACGLKSERHLSRLMELKLA
jgi:transcriptional regulator GlxA family with amidase domain